MGFDLIFRKPDEKQPSENLGSVASMGWWLQPFQAPPSGKDTFAPSDPAAGEATATEGNLEVTLAPLGDGPYQALRLTA